MKTSIKFIVLVGFVCSQWVTAQKMQNSSYEQFKVLPREKVYVSTNTSVLFTGEYLLYKAYVLNDETKRPSEYSTIAYVELINEDKDLVFSHKIRLSESQGQGDFFVPTTVPSGNYKLIAYTRWMKNGSVNLFFQEDVAIINPYQANQDAILQDKQVQLADVLHTENRMEEDKRFLLTLDNTTYAQKSKVEVTLKNFRGASGYGNYTISVREKGSFGSYEKSSPNAYISTHQKKAANTSLFYDQIRYAPELDGDLLKGQLLAKGNMTSVAGKKIGVSVPGEDFQLKVVRTDSSGVFHVNISHEFTQPYAIFQVLDEAKGLYDIQIVNEEKIDYSSVSFKKFFINESMKDAIVQRSVHNQVENGFFGVKPDTVLLDKFNDPYGGAYIEIINLEEYTRFKTLDETIVELVPNVWTKKNTEGVSVFKARSFDETYEELEFDALVYIDGLLIPDPHEILDFDTRTVVRINTVREKYYVGGKTYFGMVNIETKEGNYFEQLSSNDLTKFTMRQARPFKNYYTQTEHTNSLAKIPDFRDQLLWKPSISFEGKEKAFTFYTSEVPGEYEVLLEGFSIYGRPVVIKNNFVVY